MEEGESISWVTYTMSKAGPVTLEAILPGETGVRSFSAVCTPNVMSLAHCTMAGSPAEAAAGESCTLTIKQHDR